MTVLRVGTRGSRLALAQTGMVADALAAAVRATGDTGVTVEIIPITTHGDTSRASLSALGGTGVFASALRQALLEHRCDVVVHSFKDLPTDPVPGLVIGAVPRRADARDVLVSAGGVGLHDLPAGARVGTGSPRRAAQLHAARPDITVVDIRGNVDSRLARVGADGADGLDAVVLAAAGLQRLDRGDVAAQPLALATWPTAPAQGALAVEVRETDVASGVIADALRVVDDATSRAGADAERGVLAGLSAGCSAPIGTTARVDDDAVALSATVYALDGTRHVAAAGRVSVTAGTDLTAAAAAAARHVVDELLRQGAADLAPIGASAR